MIKKIREQFIDIDFLLTRKLKFLYIKIFAPSKLTFPGYIILGIVHTRLFKIFLPKR